MARAQTLIQNFYHFRVGGRKIRQTVVCFGKIHWRAFVLNSSSFWIMMWKVEGEQISTAFRVHSVLFQQHSVANHTFNYPLTSLLLDAKLPTASLPNNRATFQERSTVGCYAWIDAEPVVAQCVQFVRCMFDGLAQRFVYPFDVTYPSVYICKLLTSFELFYCFHCSILLPPRMYVSYKPHFNFFSSIIFNILHTFGLWSVGVIMDFVGCLSTPNVYLSFIN